MTNRIITIAQQKGGTGKTTISANLALQFSGDGTATALLDTDPQGSVGQWYMKRQEKYPDKSHDLTFKTASAWGARIEARDLVKQHQLVVIDTPPKMGMDGRPAIEVADLVIVPISASALDVWATEPTVELARMEQKPILMVLNRISARTRIAGEIRKFVEKFDCQIASCQLGNRVHFAETMADGLGVSERRPSSRAAQEFRSLTNEIKTVLG